MLLSSTSDRMTGDSLFKELAGGRPFILKTGKGLTSAIKESEYSNTVINRKLCKRDAIQSLHRMESKK